MGNLAWAWIGIAGGLVLLVLGGELLVRGASRLAASLRISPLVIGLTVVAFGTSAPELAVSVQSALAGSADIALGNVVGSNIFNVLFILGISALIVPLVVSSQLVRWDVPVMILVSAFVLVFGWDQQINRWEGVGLFLGIIAYTWWCIRKAKSESPAVEQEFAQEWAPTNTKPTAGWDALFIAAGLVLLVFGARFLVTGAVVIAKHLGVSELVIGVTVVAAGTSLPEVMTSIVAAIRGERDIAVGNVVGSNIFNILCVLGLTSAILPGGVEVSRTALQFDVPVMIGVAIACLPIFFTGHVISRWEGALFLFFYLTYTTFLILQATDNKWQSTFKTSVLLFILPLSVVALGVSWWRCKSSTEHSDKGGEKPARLS